MLITKINTLLHHYGLEPITADHLTDDDISICLTDSNNDVRGFIWGGLMANGTMCYIDRFIVHPDHRNTGVAKELRTKMYEELKHRGVKHVLGFIRQGRSHDPSALNALKMSLGTDGASYTLVQGNINFIISELEKKGA